jgi:hypothetical protein
MTFLGKQKLQRGQLLTSDQAKPFRRQHKAPCSDCPWARKSLRGWTGAHKIEAWLWIARDYWHAIACHTRRIAAGIPQPDKELRRAGFWECAGAAIFRANTAVRYFEGRPLLRLPANTVTVFADAHEFSAHHGEES